MDLVDIKTHDYLDEDVELRSQKYVCLSFISPEHVIKQKNVFFFKEFTKNIGNDITLLINNLSLKFKDDEEILDMLKSLLDRYDYLGSSDNAIYDEYETFIRKSGDELETRYLKENNFQTSVRGIKVRGSYETLVEAQNRAKQIQSADKNFNVYVAQVGCWCPWDPNPDNLTSEFADTQLNTLMKKYVENQNMKNDIFEDRKTKIMAKPFNEDEASGSGQAKTMTESEVFEELKKYS